ncbi:MAG: GNAT family N-acetyltransferase [Desulfobacterales bacterium]|jgi:CelD/BcsL family acetyltransferase involved in cellulose biosynthesis
MNLNKQKIEIKTETFERLESFFLNNKSDLNWNCLFVLPLWLKTWWDTFGENHDPEILAGYREGKLIGLAPLHIQGETARFIGGENVCDYQDMIVASNHCHEFLNAILAHLNKKRIQSLQLGTLRPDSTSLTQLPNLAEQMGYAVESHPVAFSYEIILPNTWESYLYMLKGKQRHEIRRKLRRLNEAGNIKFRVIERLDEIYEAMGTFFSLFKASRPDKSEFLTEQMMSFFRLLAQRMAQQGFLRLFFLDIDQVPAAGVMCFDYNNTLFLYNNGYNPQFSHLSPGFLSKVYSIRDSIEQGKLRYDLLKGDEGYKKRLGSTPVPLYHLKIDLEG